MSEQKTEKANLDSNYDSSHDSYWNLFSTFFKIGAFTFGGGWAMISIIEREIVDKHHWIERNEFLDLLAIAQSLPGILAVNIATAVGDKIKGGREYRRRCRHNSTLFPYNSLHRHFPHP